MSTVTTHFANYYLDADAKEKLEAGTHEIDRIVVDQIKVKEIDPVDLLDRIEMNYGITNWRGVILKMVDSGAIKPFDLKRALEEETEAAL